MAGFIERFQDLGDFGNLIFYEFFKNFAISILGIFIPILIYSETQNLLFPGIYLLVKSATGFITAYPAMRIINRYGFRSGLSASYIFLLPSVILIYLLEIDLLLVSCVAVLYSIGKVFHTESRDLEFAEGTETEERELKAAHLMSLPNVGRLVGPVVGGVVSASAGFGAMLITAFVAILISLVPARNISLKTRKKDLGIKSVLTKKNLYYSPVFLSRGIQADASVALFSLFTFIFIAGSLSSGVVRTMDTLGFMLMAYLSGYISSRYSRLKIIAAGASLAGITYILRVYVSTPLEAFAVSIVGGLAFKLYDIPLFSDFADRAEDIEERSFYTAKKMFNSLGKVFLSSVFILVAVYSEQRAAFTTVFIIAALSTALMIITQKLR